MKQQLRLVAAGLFALLGVALAASLFALPPRAIRLAAYVEADLAASGVRHPVTAVLLNFRGYDTLLEIAVLQLALLGVLASGASVQARAQAQASPQLVLQAMARILAPLMLLVAGYLLWAGAHQPGGAFQAGAVAAAGGVLLHLARLMPAWRAPGQVLRGGLVAGFLVFLFLATVLLSQGALLQFPPQRAGLLILVIETGLTVSLALTLASLFLWLPQNAPVDVPTIIAPDTDA